MVSDSILWILHIHIPVKALPRPLWVSWCTFHRGSTLSVVAYNAQGEDHLGAFIVCNNIVTFHIAYCFLVLKFIRVIDVVNMDGISTRFSDPSCSKFSSRHFSLVDSTEPCPLSLASLRDQARNLSDDLSFSRVYTMANRHAIDLVNSYALGIFRFFLKLPNTCELV